MAPYRVSAGPERIVCLTEEPTEILCLLGEERRIVGISAFTCRPEHIRAAKPAVSGFTGGNLKKIVELKPDLVIGFSDIQAELAKDLVAANLQVLIFNQRSLQEILDVVLAIGRLVGAAERAQRLVDGYIKRLDEAAKSSKRLARRPRVYFEEWDEPMISGIQWVSELIDLAGGTDIFADRAGGKSAKERFVTVEEVCERNPEVFIASWCGKPFDRAVVVQRPGFSGVAAVEAGRIHELQPSIILQPGPACLTDGLAALEALLKP